MSNRNNGQKTEDRNPDGTFAQEAHEMWSCVDCHADIEAIPHDLDKERTVDCLQCHEETPE